MAESKSHKRAKSRAAGSGGRTEVSLRGKKRVDAVSEKGKRITEVERSSSFPRIKKAAQRLKRRRGTQKVLQVPNGNVPKARRAMQEIGVGGTVKNMSGTRRSSVKAK